MASEESHLGEPPCLANESGLSTQWWANQTWCIPGTNTSLIFRNNAHVLYDMHVQITGITPLVQCQARRKLVM